MAIDNWRYARNATDRPQVMATQLLQKYGGWVSVLPVGLVEVNGSRLVLGPGQIVKIPYPVWSEGVYRNPNLETVSAEQVGRVVKLLAEGHAYDAACVAVFSIVEPEEQAVVPKAPVKKRRT